MITPVSPLHPMSTEFDTSILTKLLEPLTDAQWIVGGGLRFDDELMALHEYLKQYLAPRQLRHITATPPCLWSLDWLGQRALIPDGLLVRRIREYNAAGIAVSLVFDNAFIPEHHLDDDYGIGLVHELSHSPLNSLWIASDALRDHLRQHFPRLPLYAHPNRIYTERQKRSASLYQKLSEQYDRVALHPRDATRTEIYSPLATEAARYIIIANDRCIATCPLRREHLQQLALRREHPYQSDVRLAIQELQQRTSCLNFSHTLQGKRGNLSQTQLGRLYELGYRHFAILDERIRSAADLFHDLFHFSLNQAHEIQHIRATLVSTLYAFCAPTGNAPATGMADVTLNPNPRLIAP